MDLIFHGPLGMELSLNKSTGVARVKAAEKESPAQLVLGRALTAIEGVPVGEIRDKKSWLAVGRSYKRRSAAVSDFRGARGLAGGAGPAGAARPGGADALAASAKAAAEQADAEAAAVASAPAPARGRQAVNRAGVRFGPRSRSPSPELTCSQCGSRGSRADGFFNGTRLPGLFCSEDCKAKSLGRLDLERASTRRAPASWPSGGGARGSRSPRRRRESSPPRRNRGDRTRAAGPRGRCGEGRGNGRRERAGADPRTAGLQTRREVRAAEPEPFPRTHMRAVRPHGHAS